MTQTREKWNSLVLSRGDFYMVERCHGIPCFYFIYLFIYFCLEATIKRNTWIRTISVTVMVIISKVLFWKLLDINNVQLYSNIFLNNYKAHWQRHFKDTLQILRTWINIHANSFLGKYHEMIMDENRLEIISCAKIRACSLKSIAPGHFTYYCILCFSKKPNLWWFKFMVELLKAIK